MAKTKRKRRRKHRGTQAGTVQRKPAGRPRNRAEARARAQRQREERQLQPPTWQGALGKGLLASALFFVVFVLLFGRPIGPSLGIAAFMLIFYVPFSYYLDRFFWRRRVRQAQETG